MDQIVENVITKFRYRSNVGIKKYKTTLKTSIQTKDEFLVHLQEELMDATNYIEKLLSFKTSCLKIPNDLNPPPTEPCLVYCKNLDYFFIGTFDSNWDFYSVGLKTNIDYYIEFSQLKQLI